MKEAELKSIKIAIKMDKRPRVELTTANADLIKQYVELGVMDFSLRTDVSILYDFWKTKGHEFREALSKLL
ncbi:hypothetical protein PQ610_06725 [Tardisphaera miroshnichenkoae]